MDIDNFEQGTRMLRNVIHKKKYSNNDNSYYMTYKNFTQGTSGL